MLGHSPLSSKPLSTEEIVASNTIYELILSTSSSNTSSFIKNAAKSLVVQYTGYSTITGSNLASGSSASTTMTTSSITTVTGRLYMAYCLGLTPSMSNGLGLTWTQINAGTGNTGKLYYAVCSSGSTGTLTATGGSGIGTGYLIDEIIGADTSSPIVQSQLESTGDGTPTIGIPTLSAFGNANNATYGAFASTGISTFATSMTAEAGYTTLRSKVDMTNMTSFKLSLLSSLNSGNDTTPTCTFAGTSQTGYGFGVEIKAVMTSNNGVPSVSSIIKAANKLLSNTVSKTTSIVKSPSKSLNTSSSNTTSLLKNIGKTLSTSISNVVSIIADFVSGSNVIDLLLETSSSSSSSLVRNVAKSLLTTGTNTSTIVKSVAKRLNTSSSNVVSILKNVAKVLNTSISNSSTLTAIKTVVLLLSTSASNTTSLVRNVAKRLNTSVSNNPTIVRTISKLFSVVSSNTTTIRKVANKLLSVVSSNTTTIAFVKAINLLLSTTVSNVSSITKSVNKLLSSTVSKTTSIVKSVAKRLNSSSSSVVTIIRNIGKLISTSSVGVATVTAIASVIYYLTLATSSVANSSIVRNISKSLITSASKNTTLIKSVNKLMNVVESSNSLITKAISKTLSANTVSSLASVSKNVSKTFTVEASNVTTIVVNLVELIYNIAVFGANWFYERLHKHSTTVEIAGPIQTIVNLEETPIFTNTTVEIVGPVQTTVQIENDYKNTTINIEV